MKGLCSLFVVIFSFTVNANQSSVELTGLDISKQYPSISSEVDMIWEFVSGLLDPQSKLSDKKNPNIHFSSFEVNKQDEEWNKWQKQWLKEHPETEFPRTEKEKENAVAYTYSDSNRIQLNPIGEVSFLAWGTGIRSEHVEEDQWSDPFAKRKREKFLFPLYHGYGYFLVGHEFLHFVLDRVGISEDYQHCLMLLGSNGKLSLEELLINFLVEKKLSHDSAKLTFFYTEKYLFGNYCEKNKKAVHREVLKLINFREK